MEPRFKVLSGISLEAGGTRYRIFDSKDQGNSNKYGIHESKEEADAICSKLNAKRFQVVPPQEKKLVSGFVVEDTDFVPAFVGINYHIVDSRTGDYTGDDFETEPEAIARAEELERLNP
ncbi:hypothetical protein [Pseudomonas sp. BLCC-B112]|uniref:hypothetical protein n=1 Tax=Pseudomonas sp. BLCC-B112 TaxID=3025319 RepID=UPI00234C1FEC|nr:hypothetical protein [Pseudomonas sp. BLCC-B112]MDC7818321.1 hypothetical protein [Pseudomonas sp. BLCC-B112]